MIADTININEIKSAALTSVSSGQSAKMESSTRNTNARAFSHDQQTLTHSNNIRPSHQATNSQPQHEANNLPNLPPNYTKCCPSTSSLPPSSPFPPPSPPPSVVDNAANKAFTTVNRNKAIGAVCNSLDPTVSNRHKAAMRNAEAPDMLTARLGAYSPVSFPFAHHC